VSNPRYLRSDTWQLTASAHGAPDSQAAQTLVGRVRAEPSSFPVVVGGTAAALYDQHHAVAATLPVALAMLFVLTVAALWLMTGSIVLPVLALLMNLLTALSAAGIVAFVFQGGHLASLLGASKQAGIEQTDFLVLIAIVFGISTDYGVFLFNRIKEARDRGLPHGPAIAHGVQRTGSIVTAAALLLAVALGAFMTSKLVFLKELGVGAVAAVLIDAFAVRALIVPALMRLLGDALWWSPAALRRLSERLRIREAVPPAREPATSAGHP